MKKEHKIFIVFIFLFIILAFLRFPDSRNELKYLLIVKQSFNRGDFFILKYLNESYPDKPPLYFWLVKILYTIFGESAYFIALIFLSFLPFLGLIYLFLWQLKILNKKDYQDKFKIFIITTPFYVAASIFLRMDMLMTFFITLNLSIFLCLYLNTQKINRKNLFIFYLSLVLALLIKGPVGILFPIIVETTFLYLEKNLSFYKKLKIKQGILGILIFIVLWFLLILTNEAGKEYIKMLLGEQTIGRALKASSHARPLYFYILHIPLAFFPYGFFYLYGIYYFIKNIRYRFQWTIFEKWIFSWVLPTLVFFSMLSGKLDIYLLPILPAVIFLNIFFLNKIELKYINIKKIIKYTQYLIFSLYMSLLVILPVYKKYYSVYPLINYLEKNKIKQLTLYHANDLQNLKFYLEDLNFLESNSEYEANNEYIIVKKKYLNEIKNEYEKISSGEEYILIKMKKLSSK